MKVCAKPITRGPDKGQPATGSSTGHGRHLRAGEAPCEECRIGHRDKQRKWRRENPNYMRDYRRAWRDRNPNWERDNTLRQKYGMEPEQYERMLEEQGHACAICRTETPNGKGSWHVDHDHACCPTAGESCGQCVRGILCSRCNVALGGFYDNPDILMAAIAYLMQRPSVQVQPDKETAA